MFAEGSFIMYGSTGVCRVEKIAPMPGSRGAEKERLYYKLSPLFGSGVIYVPVDTQIFMRPVLTRREALALIRRLPEINEDPSLASADRHSLSAAYQARLHAHDCAELVPLIKTLHHRQQDGERIGKHLCKTDQDCQKRAEWLLHSELAVALEIPLSDVPDFIRTQLQKVSS